MNIWPGVHFISFEFNFSRIWRGLFFSWVCTQGRRTRGGCGCFNTHTFRDERVQHPHFFCSFSAVSHKRLTAVAPRFLWPPCVWECARCSCLLSPPSQTWHRLWVWPADDWLFCLKSRLSWCVRFIGQLVLRRRELMVIYISLFQAGA